MKPYPIERVSVVIPVYNEEASLPELLRRVRTSCNMLPYEYQVILVDDGSRDRSADLLEEAAGAPGSPFVAVILSRNYGQHAAIMAGFEQCQGDVVVTLDADLQNPPEEIVRLVQVAAEGYDVVGTVRQARKDSLLRKLPSKLINHAALRSTGVTMTDYGCMLRAYRRTVVDAMLESRERSTFIPILANSFARHVTEIPVSHAAREQGESKYGFMKLVSLMFDLTTSMTTMPLRLLSLFGAALAAFGFVFALLLLVLRLANGPEWAAQGVFVLFAVLFIFTGAQFVGLGLLGEYLGRVYHDVRARPRFYVERIVRSSVETTNREAKDRMGVSA